MTGAGDTVIATIALARWRRGRAARGGDAGQLAAGVVVGKIGTATG